MPLLDLFFTMLYFFLFFLWIWLLISLFADIFRRKDIGGGAKAAWVLFLIILPLIGALIYLITAADGMAERREKDFERSKAAQDDYIRSVAGGSTSSTADELEKFARLREQGVITNEEFEAQKAVLLG